MGASDKAQDSTATRAGWDRCAPRMMKCPLLPEMPQSRTQNARWKPQAHAEGRGEHTRCQHPFPFPRSRPHANPAPSDFFPFLTSCRSQGAVSWAVT